MESLEKHNQIHNDIKPQNYLVKFPKKSTNLTEIEIVLTDFGLAGFDSKGGTPIFASPESLANRKRKTILSDVFSLGRVFLFLLFQKEKFLEFLYVSLNKEGKDEIMRLIEQEPILNLIWNMMRVTNRIGVSEIRTMLKTIFVMKNYKTEIKMSKVVEESTSIYTKQYLNDLRHFS